MTYKIDQTKYFRRKYKKIPKEIQGVFKGLLSAFIKDPFAQCFKTHKLHGNLKECYASSINYSYRFAWVLEGDLIVLINIGNHSIYQ